MNLPAASRLKLPDLEIENKLGGMVIGVDEVGRGPLAGPVVAAAIATPDVHLVADVNDSKKCSKLKRLKIFELLIQHSNYSIGSASVEEIEQINILQATLLAMRRAIAALKVKYDWIIVDGNISPDPSKNHILPIISGDSISLSIAAASIIAKVTRDNLMDSLHQEYPDYGWDKNAGYGTRQHIGAIKQHGLTIHHRKSFCSKFI